MIVAIRSKEVIIIDNEQENLRPKHSKADSANPKHIRKESLQPKHVKAENRRPRILRAVIAVELISVILACGFIYRLWCHNFEVRIFGKVCSVTLASASESMNDHTHIITKTYMESVAEEVFEKTRW